MTPTPTILRTCLLALCLVAATGCIIDGGGGGETEQDRLDNALTQWNEAAISDYVYTYRKLCFCAEEDNHTMTLEVNRGVVVRAFDEVDRLTRDPRNFDSVNDLFDLIQNLIDQQPDELTITYDPDLGYPTYISFDVYNTADEELTIETSDLVALE
ncbi:DUF6174 domain-containing protein [Haliangium sp.]|uniref:DUF6174 domain-containing protein n=1 Tax=Haliangium sp. TaxID=2663208 RepID=UPI003D0BD6E7